MYVSPVFDAPATGLPALMQRHDVVRAQSPALAASLSDVDTTVQSMDNASPAR